MVFLGLCLVFGLSSAFRGYFLTYLALQDCWGKMTLDYTTHTHFYFISRLMRFSTTLTLSLANVFGFDGGILWCSHNISLLGAFWSLWTWTSLKPISKAASPHSGQTFFQSVTLLAFHQRLWIFSSHLFWEVWGFQSKKWQGFLVNFQWSPFPKQEKFWKLEGEFFGAEFGTRTEISKNSRSFRSAHFLTLMFPVCNLCHVSSTDYGGRRGKHSRWRFHLVMGVALRSQKEFFFVREEDCLEKGGAESSNKKEKGMRKKRWVGYSRFYALDSRNRAWGLKVKFKKPLTSVRWASVPLWVFQVSWGDSLAWASNSSGLSRKSQWKGSLEGSCHRQHFLHTKRGARVQLKCLGGREREIYIYVYRYIHACREIEKWRNQDI